MSPIRDRAGQRYGRLVAIKIVGKSEHSREMLWRCRCDCGNSTDVRSGALGSGRTKSCGCLVVDNARTLSVETQGNVRHGASRRGAMTSEFNIWRSMKSRCYWPRSINFDRYGGRGISVCDRWRDSFENFLADMGPRPSPTHMLDRIDNDGNYEPGNCRWATPVEQARNQSTNRIVTVRGQTMTLAEARETFAPHLKRGTFAARLSRGWALEAALFTSVLAG